jgi:hypothetical protein
MGARRRSVLFSQHRQLEWSLNVSLLVVADARTETELIGFGQCADLPTKSWIIGYTSAFSGTIPDTAFGFHSQFLDAVPIVYLKHVTAPGVVVKNAPSESKSTHSYSHRAMLTNSSLYRPICGFAWKQGQFNTSDIIFDLVQSVYTNSNDGFQLGQIFHEGG